jgi:hypothetical protein
MSWWYPGWSSLEHVQKLHNFFEIAAILCLACLVVTETAAFKYGRRKDELIAAAQKAAERKHLIPGQAGWPLVKQADRLHAPSRNANGKTARAPNEPELPRRLSESQKQALVAALSPFRGQKIDVVCIYGDEEGNQFSKDFDGVFRSAGWDNGGGINHAKYDQNPVGIEVTFNQSEISAGRVPRAGEALIETLVNLGLVKRKQGFLSPQAPADRITFRIGINPASTRVR